MAGETTVGSIVGFLRLDDTDWNQTLAQAGAAAQALGNSDPSVNVSANTGDAMAQLAAVQGEVDAIGQSNVDVVIDVNATTATAEERLAAVQALAAEVGATRIQMQVDADTDPAERALAHAQKSAFGLVAAAATLGPALIPVAGAVAGLGLAFGGLGAAGVLAIVGVKNALKNGSEAGVEFQTGINTLKGDLDLLAATAAGGILTAFTGSIDDLQGNMPAVQGGVAALSTELGQVMRPAADGIVSSFVALLPLMSDLAGYAVSGARAFDGWAQGGGLQSFGAYAMSVLPGVLDDLGQLVQLAGHVVGSFAGWGGGVLSLLGTLASLLNGLPTGVLSVIASGGLAIYTAFKGFGLISSLVTGLGGAMGTMAANMQRLEASSAGAALQRVAGGMRAVGTAGSIANLAVSGLAAVLGIALFAWSLYKQKQQEAKAAQEAMTQAIQEDSGALGENSRKVLAKSIADGDLISKAKDYGVTQGELMTAITQGGSALDNVTDKIKQNGTATGAASGAMGGMGKSAKVLSGNAADLIGNITSLNGEIKKGTSAYDANKLAAKALGDQQNSTGGAMSTAELAQISLTNATKDQKKAIDALNQSLQEEISKQLQLQGGLTGEAAARLSLIGTLKKSKSTTDLNTDAGVKNRQGIEQAVGTLQQYMQTQEKAGQTTSQATETYKSQGIALLQSIAKTDGANSATYRYAQQLLKLPKNVNTKVGTSGTSVSVSQLKGMQKVADKLGVTRIQVPASTPNAKNVTTLLNNISDAALSANGKTVNIKTASPQAVVTKLKLDGISSAAVAADKKSVNISTKTLNQPRTVAQIEAVLNATKDKSMTVTARGNRLDAVLNKLGLIDRTGHSRSFTVQAFMVTTTIQKHVDERLGGNYGSGRADGSVTLGGGRRVMADGGYGRPAMIAKNPILWAEAGPEAYLPLGRSKRNARTEKILRTSADILGFDVIKRARKAADGYLSGGVQAMAAGGLTSGSNSIALASVGTDTASITRAVDAINNLGAALLKQRGAARDFQAAIDSATQSIKDNGKTLDANTEKGRNNQTALDGIATSSAAYAAQVLETTGSVKQANDILVKGRAEYTHMATAMGMSGAQASKLAAKLFDLNAKQLAAAAAADKAAAAAQKSADALQAQQEAAQKAVDALSNLGNALLSQRGDARGFQAAIDSATQALTENGKTLDITTEAGRNNQSALDGIATAASHWASEILQTTGSQQQANAVLAEGRAEFLKTAITMGMSADQAKTLADALFALPKGMSTSVKVDGAEDAIYKVDKLGNLVISLKGKSITIPADAPNGEQVARVLTNISDAALSANGKTVTIPSKVIDSKVALQTLREIKGARVDASGNVTIPTSALGAKETTKLLHDLGAAAKDATPPQAPGAKQALQDVTDLKAAQEGLDNKPIRIPVSLKGFAEVQAQFESLFALQQKLFSHPPSAGGAVKAMADGGVSGRQAMVAPAGSWITWAEDSTGGEAYIPLGANKRARSLELTSQVAQRFGYDLVKRAADGYMTQWRDARPAAGSMTAGSGQGAGGTTTVTIGSIELPGVDTVVKLQAFMDDLPRLALAGRGVRG